jgi:hypothetical protein
MGNKVIGLHSLKWVSSMGEAVGGVFVESFQYLKGSRRDAPRGVPFLN